MVVQVLVPEGEGEGALEKQRLDVVDDQLGLAMILEAVGETTDEAETLLDQPEEGDAAIQPVDKVTRPGFSR